MTSVLLVVSDTTLVVVVVLSAMVAAVPVAVVLVLVVKAVAVERVGVEGPTTDYGRSSNVANDAASLPATRNTVRAAAGATVCGSSCCAV